MFCRTSACLFSIGIRSMRSGVPPFARRPRQPLQERAQGLVRRGLGDLVLATLLIDLDRDTVGERVRARTARGPDTRGGYEQTGGFDHCDEPLALTGWERLGVDRRRKAHPGDAAGPLEADLHRAAPTPTPTPTRSHAERTASCSRLLAPKSSAAT